MTTDLTKIAAEVKNVPAKDWLTDTYLPFALYVIRSRALVDVSGMKPVNRRVLWSMYQNGNTPNSKHLKAARAAADAVAYHPHASTSVEEAIAAMAQDFTLRVPLIDPSGTVGKVTGDKPAAARYWEARLTKAAMELLKEIPDGAVELGKNYDGELDEPKVLPVRWPAEIINGTQGIAVGYASKMAPHNPSEVIDACRKVLKNPNLTTDQLLKIMPGPDMPTGGELIGIDGVKDYYETGSGTFIIRGRYRVEQLTRGKVRIVFYELPFQVSAEDVREKIQAIQAAGQFKDIALVKDLTDKKNGLKLIIETKAGANHLSVLNELFKKTPVESKFPVNATVLVNNNPVKSSMIDLIKNFLEFRKLCTVKKTENRIKKIDKRIHQLDGILAVLIDIDKAIAIIRRSDTAEIARTNLMKQFKIDEEQADYILSMPLRRLTKQDSLALKNDKKTLDAEKKELDAILKSEEKLLEKVDQDLLETKKLIADPRRTIISGLTTEDAKEAQKNVAQAARNVEKNLPCVITRFADGRLLKSDGAFAYTSTEKKFYNSPIVEQIKMKTQDSLVVVGSDGLGRRIPLSYLATDLVSKAKDMGLQLPRGVNIVGIAKDTAMKSDIGLAMVTKQGKVKISKIDFPKGEEFPVFLLDPKDEVVDSRWIGRTLNNTHFTMVSAAGNLLVFPASSIRVAGSKAGGVAGMKLKSATDQVISFGWIGSPRSTTTFVLTQGELTMKLTPISEIPVKNKGGMGVAAHSFKKGEETLRAAFVGDNLVAGLEGTGNSVNLPLASKRTTKGADFSPGVVFGSYEVTPA